MAAVRGFTKVLSRSADDAAGTLDDGLRYGLRKGVNPNTKYLANTGSKLAAGVDRSIAAGAQAGKTAGGALSTEMKAVGALSEDGVKFASDDVTTLATEGNDAVAAAQLAKPTDGKAAAKSIDDDASGGVASTDPSWRTKIFESVTKNLKFLKKYPITFLSITIVTLIAAIMYGATNDQVFNITNVSKSSTDGNIIIDFTEDGPSTAALPWQINPNDFISLCIDLPMLTPPLTGVKNATLLVVSVPSDYQIEVKIPGGWKMTGPSVSCTYAGCNDIVIGGSTSTRISPPFNCGSFTAHTSFRNAVAAVVTSALSIPLQVAEGVAAAGSNAVLDFLRSIFSGIGLGGLGNGFIIAIFVIIILSCSASSAFAVIASSGKPGEIK